MSRKELLAQIEEQANRYHLAKVTYQTIQAEREALAGPANNAFNLVTEEQDKLWDLVDKLTQDAK